MGSTWVLSAQGGPELELWFLILVRDGDMVERLDYKAWLNLIVLDIAYTLQCRTVEFRFATGSPQFLVQEKLTGAKHEKTR